MLQNRPAVTQDLPQHGLRRFKLTRRRGGDPDGAGRPHPPPLISALLEFLQSRACVGGGAPRIQGGGELGPQHTRDRLVPSRAEPTGALDRIVEVGYRPIEVTAQRPQHAASGQAQRQLVPVGLLRYLTERPFRCIQGIQGRLNSPTHSRKNPRFIGAVASARGAPRRRARATASSVTVSAARSSPCAYACSPMCASMTSKPAAPLLLAVRAFCHHCAALAMSPRSSARQPSTKHAYATPRLSPERRKVRSAATVCAEPRGSQTSSSEHPRSSRAHGWPRKSLSASSPASAAYRAGRPVPITSGASRSSSHSLASASAETSTPSNKEDWQMRFIPVNPHHPRRLFSAPMHDQGYSSISAG